jgi:uncharacterized protein YjbJ (UPF0337 family)
MGSTADKVSGLANEIVGKAKQGIGTRRLKRSQIL